MSLAFSTKADKKPFSEVICSTNEVILAQCYKEITTRTYKEEGINQGSTVKIVSSYDTSCESFGIITKINNSSLDNIHKPSALGLNSKELEELQPQVYDLLRKEIEIYLFAYRDKSQVIVKSPPTNPMMVHDFVYLTTKEEVSELTEEFSTLANLIKKNKLRLELLIGLITTGYKLRSCNYNYLVKTGQEISSIFSDEVESLIPVLKTLATIK